MKIEAPKTEIQNYSRLVARLLAEPFLAVGIALFWATALPAAALFFTAVTAADQIRGYVNAPAMAGARLWRRTA